MTIIQITRPYVIAKSSVQSDMPQPIMTILCINPTQRDKDFVTTRSTNAKAARLLHTAKAFASVLLSEGRLWHCA
jgi:hypothetical protein